MRQRRVVAKSKRRQLKQLQAQLDQAKMQYASLTGSRGLGEILPEDYTSSVPRNWQETLAAMEGGGSVGSLAQSIAEQASQLDDEHFNDVLDDVTASMQANLDNDASAQALNAQVYDNSGNRFERLQNLMGQIDSAQDMKAISDLQARLQVETGMLMNELIKLQSMNAMIAKRDSLQESEAIQSSFRLRAGSY
ncbi:type IV secretion system protein [Thermomonas sp.]|uniref:type IV secretion system protein n=1 Tax=Thermomonas sp. TaxID=1971895 RepID=UPI0026054659|nr:type IV secretion system protein [Thermomonas sp.]MCO5055517.1 P-type DNA transfer protein VirB5 [Thermomonas sp.]